MRHKGKLNIVIALLAILIMVFTTPSKPSDFGKQDVPTFYKVRKFLVCSVCYVGYNTGSLGEALGISRWKPCGFGILGMTFDIDYTKY